MIVLEQGLYFQQMSQQQARKPLASQIMEKLLSENCNDPDIKRQLRNFCQKIQKNIYEGIVGTQESYLQAYGLASHEEQHFNYINQILHERTVTFLDKIEKSVVQVKSTIPPPPPPPPEIPKEIVDEVEEVLKNIDLPISLFKRQDHYWSQDNSKTIQVKEYIKQLHDKDRQWKSQLKKKRQEILNQKNQRYHQTIDEQNKIENKNKEEDKLKMIKKIQQIRSMSEARKRTIDEGLEFIKKQGRPMYKKMQEDYYNRVQLPTLQQKKKKLSEVRQLRRSVDLVQIQQHRQKYDKIKQQHEQVKITNEKVKVSFKGEFYKHLQQSNVKQRTEDSRAKSFIDRKKEYQLMVRQNFKPQIDEQKVAQVSNRIEEMSKRFARAKNRFKKKSKSQEDDEQLEQEEEEEEEPEPDPQPEEDEDQQDDEDKIQMPKDDQYEPTHEERYKMGLKFLQEAKAKRKARSDKNKKQVANSQNKTFTIDDKSAVSNPPTIQISQSITPGPLNQSNRKIKYRNYLHEMSKTNKTIDFIDTSRIKNQFTGDMKVKDQSKIEDISNKIRYVEEKAKNEQELLKYKKMKKKQAIDKKLELDSAIIDTIKARLAMMNN